jgi:hypothetical protein
MGSSRKFTRRTLGRLVLIVAAIVLGALAFPVGPASAGPEHPETTTPTEVRAETALLHGVLNPGKEGEMGTYPIEEYEFLYKESPTECEGGSVVPASPGMSLGGGKEEVSQELEGLTKGTDYTACLRVKGSGGEAVSLPITFTTTIPPEAPTGEEANPVAATTATLKGILNAGAVGDPGSYEFHYRQSEVECAGEGEKVLSGTSTGTTPEPVEAQVSELLPDMPYTFCLRAVNASGEEVLGTPVTFTTLAGPPAITSESVSGVEVTAATLEAEIEPDGSETTYHFEYGFTTSSEHSTPESASIGTGDAEQAVGARIAGIAPGTSYHYRVVATNAQSPSGGTPGPDKVFTTPRTLIATTETCENAQLRAEQPYGLTLPECRAYEMVSPIETNGQDATDTAIVTPPRASLSGEAITYASRGGFAGPRGEVQENQLLSRRGANGWETHAVTPLHEPKEADSHPSYEAAAFTPELTAGVANSNASLVAGAPVPALAEKDLYVAELAGGSYQYVAADATDPMGASEDLSHVVFGEFGKVFEWMDGDVSPVNVDNTGTVMTASVGSQAIELAQANGRDKDVWHAVSSDGKRVYFTSPGQEGEPDRQLYVRMNANQLQSPMSGEECTIATDACTIEVSASQRKTADPHGPQSARYWGASADGENVFFTSTAELTDDAYTGTEDNAENLYKYDLETGALTDLTVDTADVAAGAEVQGVVQISEDGSYVYFVADGKLAAGAQAGQRNLYFSHEGGAPTFIAALAQNDLTDWGYYSKFVEMEPSPAINSAVLTPNGEEIAFMTERSLETSNHLRYDNIQSRSHQCEGEIGDHGESETGHCREVYVYDAQTHELTCASCDPSGARPVGPSSLSQLGSHYAFTEYRARSFLEDGTLFFNSSDALVPGASDERQNVYDYHDGHVQAISNVSGASPSFFLDASASGRDVFFATADDLVPQDTGTNVVVYDARVGGGFPAAVSPTPCTGTDSCKPSPAPQPEVFGPPASGTFSGLGNLPPATPTSVTPKKKTAAELRAEKLAKALKSCRKKDKSKKKRATCEKSARKRYGAAKAKKARTERRTSR